MRLSLWTEEAFWRGWKKSLLSPVSGHRPPAILPACNNIQRFRVLCYWYRSDSKRPLKESKTDKIEGGEKEEAKADKIESGKKEEVKADKVEDSKKEEIKADKVEGG